MNKTKHEFALYWPQLSEYLKKYQEHALFQIHDKELVHRIVTVLRCKPEDQLILFDKVSHVHGQLGEVSKKICMFQINAIKETIQVRPSITFGLPLLKKEAFETALYSLVEIGATSIQLLLTEKVHRSDWSAKDAARSERIIIAAAEQSKHFALPESIAPIQLKDFLTTEVSNFDRKIFFDPDGQSLKEVLGLVAKINVSRLFLMIGPEGDLTIEEKELLQQAGFLFCALTPTILRSQQAAAVGLGAFRALL